MTNSWDQPLFKLIPKAQKAQQETYFAQGTFEHGHMDKNQYRTPDIITEQSQTFDEVVGNTEANSKYADNMQIFQFVLFIEGSMDIYDLVLMVAKSERENDGGGKNTNVVVLKRKGLAREKAIGGTLQNEKKENRKNEYRDNLEKRRSFSCMSRKGEGSPSQRVPL